MFGKHQKELGENKVSVLLPNRVLGLGGIRADFAEKLSGVGRGSRERIEGMLGRGSSACQGPEAWDCIKELLSRSGDGKLVSEARFERRGHAGKRRPRGPQWWAEVSLASSPSQNSSPPGADISKD